MDRFNLKKKIVSLKKRRKNKETIVLKKYSFQKTIFLKNDLLRRPFERPFRENTFFVRLFV